MTLEQIEEMEASQPDEAEEINMPASPSCGDSDNNDGEREQPSHSVSESYVIKYRVTGFYRLAGEHKIASDDKRCKTFKYREKAEAYAKKLETELLKSGASDVSTAIEEVHVKETKKKKCHEEFNPQFRTRAIWLKFYPEAFGLTDVDAQAFKEVLQSIKRASDAAYMHGIVHDKCKTLINDKDDSDDKLHMHLLFMSALRESDGRLRQFRMSTIYKILSAAGWLDRDEDREELFQSTKFPSLKVHDEAKIITYHTHETEEAIAESKHLYDRSECVTNIPLDMLNSIYDYYEHAFRKCADLASNGKAAKLQDLTLEQKANLGEEAQHLGEAGKDFSEWWLSMPAHIKVNATLKRSCLDLYNMGFQSFINSDKWIDHTRVFVYVYGSANSGKSYNAYNALTQLGDTYKAENSDTGKYDRLTALHRCMIFDDTSVKKLLNVAEDAVCALPRRGCDNRPWVGDYAVVTHNLPFQEWIKQVQHVYEPAVYEAVKSRTFVVHVDDNQNAEIEQYATRGTPNKQRQRLSMFKDFMTLFVAGLDDYRVKKQTEPAFDIVAEAAAMGLTIKKQSSTAILNCMYKNTPCPNRNKEGVCTASKCRYEGGC